MNFIQKAAVYTTLIGGMTFNAMAQQTAHKVSKKDLDEAITEITSGKENIFQVEGKFYDSKNKNIDGKVSIGQDGALYIGETDDFEKAIEMTTEINVLKDKPKSKITIPNKNHISSLNKTITSPIITGVYSIDLDNDGLDDIIVDMAHIEDNKEYAEYQQQTGAAREAYKKILTGKDIYFSKGNGKFERKTENLVDLEFNNVRASKGNNRNDHPALDGSGINVILEEILTNKKESKHTKLKVKGTFYNSKNTDYDGVLLINQKGDIKIASYQENKKSDPFLDPFKGEEKIEEYDNPVKNHYIDNIFKNRDTKITQISTQSTTGRKIAGSTTNLIITSLESKDLNNDGISDIIITISDISKYQQYNNYNFNEYINHIYSSEINPEKLAKMFSETKLIITDFYFGLGNGKFKKGATGVKF